NSRWLRIQSVNHVFALTLTSYFRFTGLRTKLALRRQVLKPRVALDEGQADGVGGAVALFGNDDFGPALEVGIVLLVHLFAEDEGDHVGVLLDGARFAQVGMLRTVNAGVATRATGNPTATQLSRRRAGSPTGQTPREHCVPAGCSRPSYS